MKRVGGFRRKNLAVRRVEIWNSVGKHTAENGFASLTNIAKDLKMTRSSHLRDIVIDLVTADKIDMRMGTLIDGRETYQFFFSNDRLAHLIIACDLPWACSVKDNDILVSSCTTFDNGERRVCPVSYMNHTAIEQLKSSHNLLTAEEREAIRKYHSPKGQGLNGQSLPIPDFRQ